MKSPKTAQRSLIDLDRADLAALLEHTTYRVEVEDDEWLPTSRLCLHAAEPYDEAIRALSEHDQKRILDAIARNDPEAAELSSETLYVTSDRTRTLAEDQRLYGELVAERQMLIQVGTGGQRIQEVDDHYRARRKRLHRMLEERGLEDPNSFPSLWDWYKHYSLALPKWSHRRTFLRELYAPLISKLCTQSPDPVPAREPTGWELVDRVMDKARAGMVRARTVEDFQGIGLLCREMLDFARADRACDRETSDT